MSQCRDLERLLVRQYTREQFIAKCCDTPADEACFRTWGAKLAGLRWEVIVKFCAEVCWPLLQHVV